ncbi:MAG: hypothetical protein LBE12_00540 [Planctomycetaceae bacterium]|nr:hypothetical protein [Planctomycetaceae bacterium]
MVVEQNLHFLSNLTNQPVLVVMRDGEIYDVKNVIRSAISAIMSRNLSHNIALYALNRLKREKDSTGLPVEVLDDTEMMFEIFYGKSTFSYQYILDENRK